MAETLWERAQKDLRLLTAERVEDPLVWEHSTRVARLAEGICSLPEVAERVVDRAALRVAAMYHDAGWVLQVRSGELLAKELFLRPTSDLQRELAADWLTHHLDGVAEPGVINLAARAVRLSNDRSTDLPEAQILTEADNLDLIGPPAICLMVRKQLAEGKTLQDLLSAWKRQEEYHYWQARIKECFRLPSVYALAERRLEALRRFMRDLGAAVHAEDLPIPLAARSLSENSRV